MQNKLFSIQSEIVWAVVKKYVPEPYHDKGKQIVKTVIDEVTQKEIEIVTDFLNAKNDKHRQNEKAKSDKRISFSLESPKKTPKGIDYV